MIYPCQDRAMPKLQFPIYSEAQFGLSMDGDLSQLFATFCRASPGFRSALATANTAGRKLEQCICSQASSQRFQANELANKQASMQEVGSGN